jgi:transposase
MIEQLTVITERVDDIPVLVADMNRMGVAELVDEHFASHGNWQGISLGRVATGWLTHILSEGDHRLNWAAKRRETLRGCLGPAAQPQDFSDDRLAIVLDRLSDDDSWVIFETALNRRTLRVYDLKPQRVRLDSTTVSGYWTVTPEGLFQLGHSKDQRPD